MVGQYHYKVKTKVQFFHWVLKKERKKMGKEYQVKVFTQNGQEITSKWLGEESGEFLNEFVSKPSTFDSLKFVCEDGSMVVIMSKTLKNSVIQIRERMA